MMYRYVFVLMKELC